MFLRQWLSLTPFIAMCLGLVGGPASAEEKKDKPPVEIVSPKDGSIVSQTDEVEGRLRVPEGWPVLFVRAQLDDEMWWVQPLVEEVSSGEFTARAHFGNKATPPGTKFSLVIGVAKSKEAAKKFKAGTTLSTLPTDLARSRPLTVFRDTRPPDQPSRESRVVQFSSRPWHVKFGRRVGPGPNDFSDAPDNVWVDDRGYLHLAITQADGQWRCAEVVADASLGYGEYRWVIAGDLPSLDRQVVLGLFTYESDSREIDFELSRWGDPAKTNAQFVVQPYTVKGNLYRFDTGKAQVLTCSLLWEKGQVRGRCWEGEDTTKKPLADWNYTGRHIPLPGKERARANLWLFEGKSPTSGHRQEVVIRSFAFKPAEKVEDH